MFKIGVIGCGNMGEAIVRGIVKSKNIKSTQIIVSDVDPDKLEMVVEKYNVAGTTSNRRVVENSQIIFLSVKPKDLENTVLPIKDAFKNKTVISVLAGIKISKIKDLISEATIIRCMPNTPALIGEGAIGVSFEENIDISKKEELIDILKSMGIVVEVNEELMDAVTGLSGSGPAYVFMFIEALIQGGIKEGLSYQQAKELAVQTVLGSARLVKETGEHPSVLRDKVSSPGGTTIYAIHKLEEKSLKDAVISAVSEATKRSRELSK